MEDRHESLVREMCDLQRHRGPDDSGTVSLDYVCLGAVRLSIIDLSEAGHMPMSDASGRWWIVYNGEVYNFKDLREELSKRGHCFHSHTDTEVVLHAYIEWGEACFDRLVGMFAFAIVDRLENKVILVRDRYGIKPLYYMRTGGHLFFSSEMKALVRVAGSPQVDRQSLLEWSLYRNVDALTPETLIEGITALLPGQLAVVSCGELRTRRYYSPTSYVLESEYERYSTSRIQEVIDELDSTLNDCVAQRLVSDVPVGTLCSGGLDSSLITALAARYSQELTGFHVSVSGYPELDEKPYAETVTKNLGIPLVSYAMSGQTFRRELPRVIDLSDFPLTHPNSVAYFLISQVARANGVIVLLSGEGADELFGGYSFRYRRYRDLLRVRPLLAALPGGIRRILASVGFACVGLQPTGLDFREMLPHAVALMDRYARRDWQLHCQDVYAFVSQRHHAAVLGTMLADLNDFLAPLLRRLDRMSMGASVECRVPYLDHRLAHKVINLPLSLRLRPRSEKWILQQIATRYLPATIVQRKKKGFPLPLQDYVGPLATMDLFKSGFCSEVLGFHERGLEEVVRGWRKNAAGFFSLLSLELWGRLFIWQETVEQMQASIVALEEKAAERQR